MDDDGGETWEPFVAEVDGDDQRPTFAALVDAMGWVESHDRPTGAVLYLGATIIRYENGNVDLAHAGGPSLRQPMFIVSTEGRTATQMKSDASNALRAFQGVADGSGSAFPESKKPQSEQ